MTGHKNGRWCPILLVLAAAALAATGRDAFGGSIVGSQHVTDGVFAPGEWTGPNVAKDVFAFTASGAGGASLYVEQTSANLYLAYDYVHSDSIGGVAGGHASFDVFFQVRSEKNDYLVRMFQGGGFLAFEKPTGTLSTLNPDGSLNPGSPWVPLSQADLTLAGFQAAIGFGPSPDSPTGHLIAEFQLTIDRGPPDPKNPDNHGLYDPAPAFWSASSKNGNDPPISSAIFQLNPDGSTTTIPVFTANGDPALQPQDVATATPEPATILSGVFATVVGLIVARRRRAS